MPKIKMHLEQPWEARTKTVQVPALRNRELNHHILPELLTYSTTILNRNT